MRPMVPGGPRLHPRVMIERTLVAPSRLAPHPLREGVWIPIGLVVLGAFPALAGVVRLLSFGGHVALPDTARFAAHPGVLALHVASALTFSVVGAAQFWPGLRAHRPRLHRVLGRILVPAGFGTALAGLATMLAYAPAPNTGPVLHALRALSGLALLAFLALGTRAIGTRDFRAHAAWMTRAYAFAAAPGVQAAVLAPLLFGAGIDSELTYTAGMAFGWATSLAVSEWRVRRRPSAPSCDLAGPKEELPVRGHPRRA